MLRGGPNDFSKPPALRLTFRLLFLKVTCFNLLVFVFGYLFVFSPWISASHFLTARTYPPSTLHFFQCHFSFSPVFICLISLSYISPFASFPLLVISHFVSLSTQFHAAIVSLFHSFLSLSPSNLFCSSLRHFLCLKLLIYQIYMNPLLLLHSFRHYSSSQLYAFHTSLSSATSPLPSAKNSAIYKATVGPLRHWAFVKACVWAESWTIAAESDGEPRMNPSRETSSQRNWTATWASFKSL